MNIIEIFANRRSGHHLFLSWLVSNTSGVKDTKTKELNYISWLNDKVCHMNDSSHHAFFNFDKVNQDLNSVISKNPDYLYLNYEEAGMDNFVSKDILQKQSIPTTKVIFQRDFLNMMASKWKTAKGPMYNIYFGFETEKVIKDNINDWKNITRYYLSGDYPRMTYEDLLSSPQKRIEFLETNFNKSEDYPLSEMDGTQSSFVSKDFNKRYLEVEFNQLFKDIASSDTELNELIEQMGYNSISSIL